MKHWIAAALLILSMSCLAGQAFSTAPYNRAYDPARDPAVDVAAAGKVAAKEGKFILLELGGNWCVWCHRLDRFIGSHAQLKQQLLAQFEPVMVNISEENDNAEFIAQLPAIKGYPYFVILDAQGKVIGEQNTGLLEQGKGYSTEAFKAFLDDWLDKLTSH